ncbi:MAG: hypothetical protein EA402_08515 [Planctomycetota bacterium]|nr:MAG: hypothetical protein EA402_08515 [Planctomycetota bacterium]
MIRLPILMLTCLLIVFSPFAANGSEHPLTTIAEDGTITIHQVKTDPAFNNPTDETYEAVLRERYNALLTLWARRSDGSFGTPSSNKFAENEKRSYPDAMMHILAGNVAPGVRVLEASDSPQSPNDNDHTFGIDLYWAFTLKGQVRKFFHFRPLLNPDYIATMERAIDAWTKSHPRFTPHPVHQRYRHDVQGWGPNRFGHRQVDGRRTDNLYAMSTGSVYLFAEAAGNEETRLRAKSEILGYVWALYSIGHGEWDSIAYHSHVVAPFINIYDFAQDPEVKMAAKLALDHFFTAAALRYHKGAFLGASKRDYGGGGYRQMDSGFMDFFHYWFGHAPGESSREPDQIHAITTSYRPPPAVRAIARRNFKNPVEIRATKPNYENWQEGMSDRPRNFDSQWIGRHGGIGSTIDPGGNGDLAPFRAVLEGPNDTAGVVAVAPTNRLNTKLSGCQIAQHGNLVVWITPQRDQPWNVYFTKNVEKSESDGVIYLATDRAWIAIHRSGIGEFSHRKLSGGDARRFTDAFFYAAPHQTELTVMALEYAERGDFDSLGDFQQAVANNASFSFSDGVVNFTGASGRILEVTHNPENDIPIMRLNGELRDFDDPAEWALWRTIGDEIEVSLGWKEGGLTVQAGGHTFRAHFSLDGLTGPEITRQELENRSDLTASSAGFSND